MTALQVAQGGTYVALGDSYSSGEGVYDLDKSPVNDGAARCHRATGSYVPLVAATYEFGGGTAFYACSGATTRQLLTGQHGQPPQITRVGPAASLITLSIGGNDAGLQQGADRLHRQDPVVVGLRRPGHRRPQAHRRAAHRHGQGAAGAARARPRSPCHRARLPPALPRAPGGERRQHERGRPALAERHDAAAQRHRGGRGGGVRPGHRGVRRAGQRRVRGRLRGLLRARGGAAAAVPERAGGEHGGADGQRAQLPPHGRGLPPLRRPHHQAGRRFYPGRPMHNYRLVTPGPA